MQENKPELKLETQQQLTKKAQLIEAAKNFAEQIQNNPDQMKVEMMSKRFPELTSQEIENILA